MVRRNARGSSQGKTDEILEHGLMGRALIAENRKPAVARSPY
jgi:hypothetical protein